MASTMAGTNPPLCLSSSQELLGRAESIEFAPQDMYPKYVNLQHSTHAHSGNAAPFHGPVRCAVLPEAPEDSCIPWGSQISYLMFRL